MTATVSRNNNHQPHFMYIEEDFHLASSTDEKNISQLRKAMMMIETIESVHSIEKIEKETIKLLEAVGPPMKKEPKCCEKHLFSYEIKGFNQTASSYVLQSADTGHFMRYTILHNQEGFSLNPFEKMLSALNK